jgi:hypothetical protein
MSYQMKSHNVEAVRIARVEPLISQGAMMSPSSGLLLTLENGTKHKWLAAKDESSPVVDDFFVTDAELKLSYVVPADKFPWLFVVEV